MANIVGVHHEIHGNGDPVMLLAGLSGVGRGWGDQMDRFASEFTTIVPDHPGTGASAPPVGKWTIEGHAAALADMVRSIRCGPVHVVGSSTGGAIAQVMALDHREVVRSIVLVSSWARADDFFRHQFAVRKDVLLRQGSDAYAQASALFLFSPRHFRDHYERIDAWCRQASSTDPATMSARIDMILAHDQLDRLGAIDVPAMVLVGSDDVCTPPYFSEELAAAIPGAFLTVLTGGHLIYKEDPGGFHRVVADFVHRH
jgi:aminoacrylate hydrolase